MGLIGVEIHRFVLSKRIQPSESQSAANEQPMPRLGVLRSALMIGIASALGYTNGLVLGLPRFLGRCHDNYRDSAKH
jgi:hypothetical protein